MTDRDRVARIFTKLNAKNNLLGYEQDKHTADELLELFYKNENEAIGEILELLKQSKTDELMEIRYALVMRGDDYLDALLSERIKSLND